MTSTAPSAIKAVREKIIIVALVTLTPEQVAEALQLSLRTVYQYLKEGKIPGKKIGGRRYGQRWRVLEEDLRAFIRGQERRPDA